MFQIGPFLPFLEPQVTLLEFSADIHFDERVQPICLASNDHLLIGDKPGRLSSDAWVAGWKLTDSGLESNMSQGYRRNVILRELNDYSDYSPPVNVSYDYATMSSENPSRLVITREERGDGILYFALLST